MASTASTDHSCSIFKDGKVRSGIYMIQNAVGQTYADILRTKELCGRPAAAIPAQGLWEILPSGEGYTIRRLALGQPEQFCTMLTGIADEHVVRVAPFPAAWRIEIVRDEGYRDGEYFRIFWGTTNFAWDLRDYGSGKDLNPIQLKNNSDFQACRIWKFIPVI